MWEGTHEQNGAPGVTIKNLNYEVLCATEEKVDDPKGRGKLDAKRGKELYTERRRNAERYEATALHLLKGGGGMNKEGRPATMSSTGSFIVLCFPER